MTPFGKVVTAVCSLLFIVLAISVARPVSQARLVQISQQAQAFWQVVQTGDPNGDLFVSYQVTEVCGDGVVTVTVANRWFYLPAGEQEQMRDMLKRVYGRCQGSNYDGTVILHDVLGRPV